YHLFFFSDYGHHLDLHSFPTRRSSDLDKVKISGISVGKGFQGTIKRHNFNRGPVSHGSHNVRKPGSIGASATPSRVFKGIKMAGDRKSTRLNSSHRTISYAVFCLKKKT